METLPAIPEMEAEEFVSHRNEIPRLMSDIVHKFGITFLLLNLYLSDAQSIYAGGDGDGTSNTCFAQLNNSFQRIYSGGASDGFTNSCYQQLTNTALEIYSGGNGKGNNSDCYAQLSNVALNIYAGGFSDGFSNSCYQQLTNTSLDIYSGGPADGTSNDCYQQLTNNLFDIFSGGISDGHSNYCYIQQDNSLGNIYRGGSSDGISLSCAILDVGPLPVRYLYLHFVCVDSKKQLEWVTVSEKDNAGFHIERSSNATAWQEIDFMPGAGNSDQPLRYVYQDKTPLNSTHYYRLKQKDLSGKITYSKVVSGQECMDASSAVYLYPNPSAGKFHLKILNDEFALSDSYVTTLHGQVLPAKVENSELDLSAYPNGVFLVHLKIHDTIVNISIVLQR